MTNKIKNGVEREPVQVRLTGAMVIAYWILAGLLALLYLVSGALKVVRSRDQLRPMMQWVDDMPFPLVRVIGVLEFLAAIGLILPPLTHIAAPLAFVAALCLVLLQLVAIVVHLRRGDRMIAINLFALVLAAVVAWLATVWL